MATLFHLHRGDQRTIYDFLQFLSTSAPHNILSKPLPAVPHNHSRKMSYGERGMDLVGGPVVTGDHIF